MLDWYEVAQQRPSPEAPRPHDAAEAKKVLDLIARLGLTKKQAKSKRPSSMRLWQSAEG